MANNRPTDYKAIFKPVRKKDSMQLLLGKPVYTDDITPKDALVVKILRSPTPTQSSGRSTPPLPRKFPAWWPSTPGRMCPTTGLPLPARPTLSLPPTTG